ncbi:MAG: inositol-3-phosphate synthase [Deltaproteobacteria bacterium]|nr:MAG: inositol-3-phosphate synthase [Deltaproteobacteria bacterium]
MLISDLSKSQSLLLMVAGAKGAVGSTLTVAAAAMRTQPEAVLPSLMTGQMFPYLGPAQETHVVGWDTTNKTLLTAIEAHGVLPETLWKPHQNELDLVEVRLAPPANSGLKEQVEQLRSDIQTFREHYPQTKAVLINLLPAGASGDLGQCHSLAQLYSEAYPAGFPDLGYTLAAIFSGVPIVNFTPNEVEIPVIVREAEQLGVPISGRDGKTGQTYLKVVLASALRARNLFVDGWYSLNILGNEDGKNLMDPERAAEKLSNKTRILDGILGYQIGERYGIPSHKVRIDYYPPRGDAKEAWDVIDFLGLFGLRMSIRLNLQGRDSVLAVPLVLDLARWMAVLQAAGRSGPIPELGFFFKQPIGDDPPLTFQDQVTKLGELELECDEKIAARTTAGTKQ